MKFKLNRANFKIKNFLLYTIFLILPVSIFNFFAFQKSAAIVDVQLLAAAQQTASQTASYIEYKMKSVEKMAEMLSKDMTIRNTLSKDPQKYSKNDQIDAAAMMENLLVSYKLDEDVYRVRLYINNDFLFSKQKIIFFSMKDSKETQLIQEIVKYDGAIYWKGNYPYKYIWNDNQNIMTAGITVKNEELQAVGAVCVDILSANVIQILKETEFSKDSYVVLMHENEVMLSSNTELPNYFDFNSLKAEDVENNGVVIQGRKYSVLNNSLDITGWQMLSFIPTEQLQTTVETMREYFRNLQVFLIIMFLLIAWIITQLNYRRIKNILNAILKVKNGQLDTRLAIKSADEFGLIEENFNQMLDRINYVLDRNYQMGVEIKSTELKALQSQINPHLLYNSLDMIRWEAMECKSRIIVEMIEALSRFYRLGLSQGKDHIPLSDELELVKEYVKIQNIRFDGSLLLEIDVEPLLLEHLIPKITLQPIVENAVLHGKRWNAPLHISIKGTIEVDGTIKIEINDDGKGISEDVLKNLLIDNEPEKGYGLKNIRERLNLFYKGGASIKINSKVDCGTQVELRLND